MLNTGAMLAILTTITLDDYHTDQIREKRQEMKNYAGSMKSIGDNVRLCGGSITDTLRDSGRTDLEQSILQGGAGTPDLHLRAGDPRAGGLPDQISETDDRCRI